MGLSLRHLRVLEIYTWTPKACIIMAFWAIVRDFGLLSYLLLGCRFGLHGEREGS